MNPLDFSFVITPVIQFFIPTLVINPMLPDRLHFRPGPAAHGTDLVAENVPPSRAFRPHFAGRDLAPLLSPDIQNRRPPFERLYTPIVANTVNRKCSLAVPEHDISLAVVSLQAGIVYVRLLGNYPFLSPRYIKRLNSAGQYFIHH